MTKDERIATYVTTIAISRQKFYSTIKGNLVMLPSNACESKFYDEKFTPKETKRFDNEEIIVENEDCLILAKKLINRGLKPAVLNMANRHMPGGGVINGSVAQEENLFRRTNLFQSLYRYHDIGQNFGVEQDERHDNSRLQYPMDDNFGGIYSKDVVVFRCGENDYYEVLDKPFLVDVISVSAINGPKYDENFNLSEKDSIKEKNKIRTIFNIALQQGNDSLVLGAFGCGAFGTPPKAMAKLFHEVMDEDFYKNKFKVVAFAILNTNSNFKKHNPQGNFQPFKDEFSC